MIWIDWLIISLVSAISISVLTVGFYAFFIYGKEARP